MSEAMFSSVRSRGMRKIHTARATAAPITERTRLRSSDPMSSAITVTT